MNHKSLLNQIELAYAPLTAFEFAVFKEDEEIDRALQNASLYLNGQRPVITFENFIPDETIYSLNFEIHQKGNPNVLKCKLPLDQELFGLKKGKSVEIAFNYLDNFVKHYRVSLDNIHGLSLVKIKNNLKNL
jgi:hypothetical protein